MKKFVIILPLLFSINACVSSDQPNLCIKGKNLSKEKKSVEELAIRLKPHRSNVKARWKLVSKKCSHVVYNYGSLYVLFSKIQENRISYKVSSTPFQNAPSSCLKEALEDIESLNIPYSNRLISYAKDHYGIRWSDGLVGASEWISCKDQKNKSSNYYDSLNTFIHEIKHFSKLRINCSYYPWKNRTDCIEPSTKAKQALSRLKVRKNWPLVSKTFKNELINVQNLYLGNAKTSESPILILEELRAYSVGLEATNSIYKKYGSEKVYDANNKRATLIPMLGVMDLVVRYYKLRLKTDSTFKSSNERKMILESLELGNQKILEFFKIENKRGAKSSSTVRREKKTYKSVDLSMLI